MSAAAKKKPRSRRAHAPRKLAGTTRAHLLQLDRYRGDRARGVLRKKNADYGEGSDALANFRLAQLADATTSQAVFARFMDKVVRLGRAAAGRLSLRDNDFDDARNLLVLLEAALREGKR